ncbi:MAG: type II toxin-antitoxin system RelE/ParE family toxin [Clostridia bacterium]|nr:type II toxin-antitoxin system RelE/ParE family toxin [Clostridia bacterium]
MVVIWSENAKNDLKNYFHNSNIITEGKVKKYIEDLVNYSNTLGHFPHLGRKFIVYKNITIYQLLFEMHRIFYIIENDEIIIIQVSNCSRSIENVMKILKKYLK